MGLGPEVGADLDPGSERDLDGQLVQAARGGSDAAFERIVARHQQAVRGFLRRLGRAAADADDASDNQRLSLVIPGAMLRDGAYAVTVSGVAANGERTAIDKYTFDLHLTD